MGAGGTLGLAFSPRPGKAYTERLYILYTPIWTAALAYVIINGHYRSYDDPQFMILGLATMAPLWIWPLLFEKSEKPFWQRTSFRANVFIWILSYIGNYAITEYFFEILGMRYGWWNKWNFDAVVIGIQRAPVPFWLTPVTHAYFATYHGFMSVLWRGVKQAFNLGTFGSTVVVLALAYFFAWAETFVMATELIEDVFLYKDRSVMLKYGSFFYATLFVLSFPLFGQLDETVEEEKRSLFDVAIVRALAACMFTIMVLDHFAFFFGPLVASD